MNPTCEHKFTDGFTRGELLFFCETCKRPFERFLHFNTEMQWWFPMVRPLVIPSGIGRRLEAANWPIEARTVAA